MKDQAIINLIVARMDRIENKVDKLLEFKWKVAGAAIVIGAITGLFAKII